jgi:RNA polymerase sigma factor (TIGR02999 family)
MPIADPTTLLIEWRGGNRAALDELYPVVYEDLRRRAHVFLRQESPGHTLTTTALVHETYLKLLDLDRLRWEDRAHFLALAAQVMRQVLVSYARQHRAAKRGGGAAPLRLDEELAVSTGPSEQLLSLDRALDKLAALNERLSRTVELRFFGGMKVEEIAEVLGVSSRTVKLDWRKARAWLSRELG